MFFPFVLFLSSLLIIFLKFFLHYQLIKEIKEKQNPDLGTYINDQFNRQNDYLHCFLPVFPKDKDFLNNIKTLNMIRACVVLFYIFFITSVLLAFN